MKIAVCVNYVPDTTAKIKINEDKKSIDKTGVSFILNPYDEYAVEEALRTKEKFNTEVYVLSVGQEINKEAIRKALAIGADEGILLKYDGFIDSFGVAGILADEIKDLKCDLVFMGKKSIDYNNSIVGQLTAAFLKYNCISSCTTLNIEEGKIIAGREIEGGRETIETKFPVVITTEKGLNNPRYASLKGIMASKKKIIIEKNIGNVNTVIEVLELKPSVQKKAGKILDADSSAVLEFVKFLKEEVRVI
jgi:electron transfer flavoprotein beta subunit